MVLSWFASRLNPIAIDVGTETIKLLQVEPKSAGGGEGGGKCRGRGAAPPGSRGV